MEIERVWKLSKIQVLIRKRPPNAWEIKLNQSDIVEVIDQDTMVIKEQKVKVDMTKYTEENYFTFDWIFDENSTNEEVYEDSVQNLIAFVFEGGKVSVFAYGQTGSGKTFTMIGNARSPGVYMLAAKQIFDLRNFKHQKMNIKLSYFEIYCGKLFDLLNNREPIIAWEDNKQNIQIVGLSKTDSNSVEEVFDSIQKGNQLRITSTTGKNNESSWSHAILQFEIYQGNSAVGLLSFIDLAGNERGADTFGHTQQTRIDGAEISKSLLALKECIRCLDQDKKHVPFRGSKLTMVLRDSFIGNCRTVMIGNISPGDANSEYTLNTLRYADWVKELKNDKFKKKNDLMLPWQKSNQNKKKLSNQVYSSQNLPEESPLENHNHKYYGSMAELPQEIKQVSYKKILEPAIEYDWNQFNLIKKQENFMSDFSNEKSKTYQALIKNQNQNQILNLNLNQNENDNKLNYLENEHSRIINLIIDGEQAVKSSQIELMENNRVLDDKALQILNSLNANQLSFNDYLKQMLLNEEKRMLYQQAFINSLHEYRDLCQKEKSFYAEIKKFNEIQTFSPGYNLLQEDEWMSQNEFKTPFKMEDQLLSIIKKS